MSFCSYCWKENFAVLMTLKGLSAGVFAFKSRTLGSFLKEIHKSAVSVSSGHLKRLRVDLFEPRVFFLELNQTNNEVIASHGLAGCFVTIIGFREIAVVNPTGATEVVNQRLTLRGVWIDPKLIRYKRHVRIVSCPDLNIQLSDSLDLIFSNPMDCRLISTS